MHMQVLAFILWPYRFRKPLRLEAPLKNALQHLSKTQAQQKCLETKGFSI